MISGKQIRAARALLDWSLEDLSTRAGMTVAAISHIERGRAPRQESLAALTTALETEGIRFTPYGVEQLQNAVIWLPAYTDLLDDMIAHNPNQALFMNADDRKSSAEVTERVQRLRSGGAKIRFLIQPDCDFIAGNPADYRRSRLLAARDVTVIYDNRTAFWTPDGVMVIISGFLAEDYRKQFERFWDHGETI